MNPLRRFFVPVFLPAVVFAAGEGALVPVLPSRAMELGASVALAGLIAGMLMVGHLIGDLPSGVLIVRLGEQRGMVVAAGLGALGAVTGLFATHLAVLLVAVVLVGMAAAMFNLARHALLTQWVPISHRARAMSMLGGTSRAGTFAGPLITAPVVAVWGASATFWVTLACSIAVGVFLLLTPDPEIAFAALAAEARPVAAAASGAAPAVGTTHAAHAGIARTMREHLPVLMRLGVAAGIVQLLRSSRQVILPLWGAHISLDVTTISVIMGVAGGVDMLLFYASGQIMDRFGRIWVAMPTLVGLGLAHALLPAAADETWFVAAAMFMSLANSLGSGIVMTLGADLAPPDDPAPFLGAWRLFADSGSAVAPLLLSGIAAVAGLTATALCFGVIGFTGAAMMWRFIPRYLSAELSGRAR